MCLAQNNWNAIQGTKAIGNLLMFGGIFPISFRDCEKTFTILPSKALDPKPKIYRLEVSRCKQNNETLFTACEL